MAEQVANIEFPDQNKPFLSSTEQLMIVDSTTKWMEVIEREKPDMIYFLDRSARPLSWLLRQVARGRNEELPQIRFLNIGAEKEGEFEFVLEYSDFSELSTSKKYSPSKVMIVDEKSHSGESLAKGARVVQKLYGLPADKVLLQSVLSSFPSWIRNPEIIGVDDTEDYKINLLARPTENKKEPQKLRNELYQLVPAIDMFQAQSDLFRRVEEEIRGTLNSDLTDYEPPLAIPLVWDSQRYFFVCRTQSVVEVANAIREGKVSVVEGMRFYYMFKYNRIHTDDWQTESELDFNSSALNSLAKEILVKLRS